MTQLSNNYDLEDRTARFGEDTIEFCKTLKQDAISKPIISQMVRSATSIGATIWKLTRRVQEGILPIKYSFVKKKLTRQNIG